MSGKYSDNKAGSKIVEKKKTRKNRGGWILLAVLVALVIGLLVFIAYMESRETEKPYLETNPQTSEQTEAATGESVGNSTEVEATEANGQTEAPAQETTAAPKEEVTVPPTEETPVPPTEDKLLNLGYGLEITDIISYTGAFMEDRTDDVVSDVLGIQLTNTGMEHIQAMDIVLTDGKTTAEFSLSTLFPGQSIVVLEKNRMSYSTAPEFTESEITSLALFDGNPGMAEDKLKIQCLDGVINISNISEEDISGDILVYYKNYVGGIYYGGITYRLRIEGGLKAGEIRQGSAAHFNPDNSIVVFATCN